MMRIFFYCLFILPLLGFTHPQEGPLTASIQPGTTAKEQKLWKELQAYSVAQAKGEDTEWRPAFVSMQASVEKGIVAALKAGEATHAVCVIHTKLPPTPLRIKPSEAVQAPLVHAEVAADQARRKTVEDRAMILREFLNTKGAVLVALYLNADNEMHGDPTHIPGLSIYRDLVTQHANLIDYPLDSYVPETLSGASCLVEMQDASHVFFGIHATQANELSSNFSLWLGAPDAPSVKPRYTAIKNYLRNQGLEFETLLHMHATPSCDCPSF